MSCLVSINCITYNHEDYIADAIESFLMQKTNFDFEILIGEDCSTDDTKKIVERYANQYPEKIRVITSAQNVGFRKNSQRIFENSKGKYIAECEGDDYWTDPYKLQKQVDYLEQNPECTFCFHNAVLVKANKKVIPGVQTHLIKKSNYYFHGGDSNYSVGELALLGFIPTASFMYPKHLMDNLPEWCSTAIVGDVPIKLITTSYGYAHYLDETMSVYRTGVKGSIMYNWKKESGNKEKQILINEGFLHLFDNFNDFTKDKYKPEIDKAKIQFELEIVRLERERKKLKIPRYKEYFNRLGLNGKIRYYARYNFPSLYVLFTRLKAYI
ncbi:glycosyltransferase [Sporosarcina sp. E16_8]|uniref:glycosyltransferase n=1 Tax=Sporosarcina sp. E16_8 TaxID=2789295 RepID=UPI001A919690|nr:glycosyltransferase [Sporosarcina sp. E16_8]MBO0588603.1 glycosyltransferase [Sporosarcina sp. E16_8]